MDFLAALTIFLTVIAEILFLKPIPIIYLISIALVIRQAAAFSLISESREYKIPSFFC